MSTSTEIHYTHKSHESQYPWFSHKLTDILGKLDNVRRSGSGYTARCPAHPDEHNSLSVCAKDGKILLHCFAGCQTEEVVAALGLEMRDLFAEGADHKTIGSPVKVVKVREGDVKVREGDGQVGVTLAELASAKRLEEEFLKSLGLRDVRLPTGPAVAIPYFDETGNETATRYRIALLGDRFRWKRGSAVSLYGLERLRAARSAGWVLIVEGESDCWTAWRCDLPAIGVPGKGVWRSEWSRHLEGLKVYVWQEPDAEDFTLRIAQDVPGAYVIASPEGVKDISAAHCDGQDVATLLERLRATARPVAEIVGRRTAAEVEKLALDAAAVLAADDPLALIGDAIRRLGYGGDLTPALITYLCATTRLLALRPGQMPAHLLIVGPAAAGKSYTLQTVLRLMPPEAYHVIDAGSPRVLIYDDAALQHRVVVFSEADSLPAGEDNPAASAIRNLMQDGYLHYTVVVRDPETGQYAVKEVSKPGPSLLITTSVRELGGQLGSRAFTLAVPEDAKRIRDALGAQAMAEIDGVADPDPALVAYQAYLQRLAPFDVVVPFARALADAVGRSANATRILRDYQRLLALIKAVSVLRHRHRAKREDGRLIATLDDYEAVYRLVGDMYSATITGVTDQLKAVVEAVSELRRSGEGRVSYSKVAQKVGLHPEQVKRLVRQAVRYGWLTNTETRQGLPADLAVGDPLPERAGLPTPQELSQLSQAFTHFHGFHTPTDELYTPTERREVVSEAPDLPPDPYAERFKQAVEELNRRYIPGALEYIRERHPALYQKIDEADTRLDGVWRAALQGNASLEAFQETLEGWYRLHLQGIEIASQERPRQRKER